MTISTEKTILLFGRDKVGTSIIKNMLLHNDINYETQIGFDNTTDGTEYTLFADTKNNNSFKLINTIGLNTCFSSQPPQIDINAYTEQISKNAINYICFVTSRENLEADLSIYRAFIAMFRESLQNAILIVNNCSEYETWAYHNVSMLKDIYPELKLSDDKVIAIYFPYAQCTSEDNLERIYQRQRQKAKTYMVKKLDNLPFSPIQPNITNDAKKEVLYILKHNIWSENEESSVKIGWCGLLANVVMVTLQLVKSLCAQLTRWMRF